MKVEIGTSLSAIAAALMLVACASKGSVSPGSPDASARDETSLEYERLADNASQRLVCKRQAVLGSRVANVICVTEEEMKAQRENATDVLHDIRANTPMDRQRPPDPLPPPSSSPRQ